MLKRYFCFLLVFLLLLSFGAAFVSASEMGPPAEEPIVDQGGMFERAIASVVNAFVTVIQAIEKYVSRGDYRHLGELIFTSGDLDDLMNPAPFCSQGGREPWWPKLNAWYVGMGSVSAGLCLLAVFLTAFKFVNAGVGGKPDARAEASESVMRWVFAVLLIAGAPIFVRVLLLMNNALVASLVEIARGLDASTTLDSISLGSNAIKDVRTGSVLGTALVKLMFVGLELQLNIIFLVRKWVLAGIYIFTPIAAWLWAMNKNVRAAAVWVGEVLTNVFLQSAYAIAFLLILTFCSFPKAGEDLRPEGWFPLLIGCFCVMPIAGMLRNSLQGLWTQWSGVDEEGIGMKAFGMLGLAGVASLPRIMEASAQGASGPVSRRAAGAGSVLGAAGLAAGLLSPGGASGPLSGQPLSGASPASMGAGFVPAPSGLLVPPGAAAGAGASGVPVAPSGIGRALDVGRTVGAAAGGMAGAVASVATAAVPGGPALSRGVANVTAGLARFAGATGSLAVQTRQEWKRTGSLTEAVRHVSGSKGAVGGAAKMASLTGVDAVSPSLTTRAADSVGVPLREGVPPARTQYFNPGPTTSLDGFRFH